MTVVDDPRHVPPAVAPRRYFVSVRNFWFLKYYDSVLRMLAARGHVIHIVGDRQRTDESYPQWMAAVRTLAAEYPTVTFGWIPTRLKPKWHGLSTTVNRLTEYLRFLEPQFETAPVLRRRAARHVAPRLRNLLERPRRGRALVVRILDTVSRLLARGIPPTDHIEALLRQHQPDVVVVSPLVTLGSRQSEVVRAARHIGVPSVFAAGSWDHLSSKARLLEIPDAVLVWNQTQRREARDYHRVPEDRIIVTGAQCFDQWFDRRPSRDRAALCRLVGLPEDRPIVLYVCSSLFWGSPIEAAFVERWVEAVRSADDRRLRHASILIRPHPKRGEEWRGVNLDRFEAVRVWPPLGEPPLTNSAKADYFDSLFYADAIVGLNTSAQIEGAIVGRPVFTILLPEFWDNQEGTLHFHYLLEPAGGPLQEARSLAEHVVQLADGLVNPDRAAARNRAFVDSFVRPNGRDRDATVIFVDALEQVAARPRRAWRARSARIRTACLRATVRPVAHLLHLTPAGRPVHSDNPDVTGGDALQEHQRTRKAGWRSAPDKSGTTKTITDPGDKAPARPAKTIREYPPLPDWAWSMRAVIYPVVSRVNLGPLSEERRWRAARYRQKALDREAERARGLELRAAKVQARAQQKKQQKKQAPPHGADEAGAASGEAATGSTDPAVQ